MRHKRHRLNVVGPFYVEDGCCTRCGVPDATAPELFGEVDDSCFVKLQPQTASEVDRMLRAMITSEVGCIRYAGVDAAVIRRLAESGEGALADVPLRLTLRPPSVITWACAPALSSHREPWRMHSSRISKANRCRSATERISYRPMSIAVN
jgi:hypothetical protein